MCLLLAAPIGTHGVFTSFSLSQHCCLHFWRNKLGSMWAQGSKGQRSTKIAKCYFFEPVQSIRTHWMASIWCVNKYPWCFFFLLCLVYQSAAVCISEEINLDLCWCKDTWRVKGQALITNRNFYEFMQPICHLLVVGIRYAITYPWCFYFVKFIYVLLLAFLQK